MPVKLGGLLGYIDSRKRVFGNRLADFVSNPVDYMQSIADQWIPTDYETRQESLRYRGLLANQYAIESAEGKRNKLAEQAGSFVGKIIYAPNKASTAKLADVMAQMETMGAPRIRAVYDGEAYQALEGSHRLAAAKKLGLTPEIIEVSPRTWLTNHDLYDLPDKTSVARAVRYLSENREAAYSFDDLM